MTRPEGPVMYSVGWKGKIGPWIIEIVEVKLSRWRMKKGRIVCRAPQCDHRTTSGETPEA